MTTSEDEPWWKSSYGLIWHHMTPATYTHLGGRVVIEGVALRARAKPNAEQRAADERRWGRYVTSQCIILQYITVPYSTLHFIALHYNCTLPPTSAAAGHARARARARENPAVTLRYITRANPAVTSIIKRREARRVVARPHYVTLRYVTLRYLALHCITLSGAFCRPTPRVAERSPSEGQNDDRAKAEKDITRRAVLYCSVLYCTITQRNAIQSNVM